MFTYDEQIRLERLMAKDQNVNELVTAMKQDYQFTLSQISHEIRNPLTYVDSSLQSIQRMHPEVEQFEYWSQLRSDLEYIQRLLDDLSAFNQGDQLNYRKIDPKEFAYDLKDTLLPELIERHIPLLIKLDDTFPDFYADPIRLKQAFLNLLKNAMESITTHGRITLKVFTHENRLMIAVRDNGCGIAPEHQSDIYRPFITYKENGTGLGLAIVRRVVCAHHGHIRLKSTLGKGTEFQIHLPLVPASMPIS